MGTATHATQAGLHWPGEYKELEKDLLRGRHTTRWPGNPSRPVPFVLPAIRNVSSAVC